MNRHTFGNDDIDVIATDFIKFNQKTIQESVAIRREVRTSMAVFKASAGAFKVDLLTLGGETRSCIQRSQELLRRHSSLLLHRSEYDNTLQLSSSLFLM